MKSISDFRLWISDWQRRRRIAPWVGVLSLTLATCGVPPAAEAQQPGKVHRMGMLTSFTPRSAPWHQGFEQRLRELGYVEGQNLATEFRTAEGRHDRLPALAAELVRLKMDLLICAGQEAVVRACRHATGTIPIVAPAFEYDPVALGYVASLGRPGGNITGISAFSPELTAKRLQLLKEAVPRVTRVAMLWQKLAAPQIRPAEEAARSLGVRLQALEVQEPPFDYESLFKAAVRGRAEALWIIPSPMFFPDRKRIADLALKNRFPTMFSRLQYVEAGGLTAYDFNLDAAYRQLATYVDKILKGAKPADLPVEQPTRFELVINMKTAKALGLTFPQSILIRADNLIQ